MTGRIKKWFMNIYQEIINILKLKTTPRKIALGAAIAIFWNFLPSMGIGAVLSYIAAKILQASAVAAVSISLASGFLIPFFYTLNVFTGRFIITSLGMESLYCSFGFNLQKLLNYITLPIYEFNFLQPFTQELESLPMDFLLGSIINAFIAGTLIYIIIRVILNKRKPTEE